MLNLSGSVEKDQSVWNRIIELSLLYDFYGALLKDSKRQVFEEYVMNDLSLGEIAAQRGISRQGVHDIVKRCTSQLEEYETKLHLIEKFQTIEEKVEKIHKLAGEISGSDSVVKQIENLSNEILEEL